ncbi:MAG: hypothetical protein AMK69_13650 [Nitrospira bacterium SG8_3]|nr:MAG: hypothetical protein AMK69_13650 [Nitrospira bacterium SG8_3]
MDTKATVLVVDDENGIRESFKMILKDGYHVLLAETGEEALEIFKNNPVDLILLDILLPDINGVELLEKLKGLDPNTEIIMVTGVKDIQTAVKAIKLGAYQYIIKPFTVEDIINVINRALEKNNLVREVTYLRNELERYHPFKGFIGEDEKMKKIFELISIISDKNSPVFIKGESGTGKELVARAIHRLSPRKHQPFVVINCAAIPTNLMESTVFGHSKGAFTGATSSHIGKLELANKGTAFLDDIDTLDTGMQAKLLRAIQEKEFEKVGSTKLINADVRFLAASNKDPLELIAEGKFREDLFYRLNVFPITLPPLRERKTDIPLLLEHFLELNARNSGKSAKKFSKKALKNLMEYDWPGNVRELQNLVERSFTISKKSVIQLEDISPFHMTEKKIKERTLKEAVNAFEREYIYDVLHQVDGSRTKAAEILGIHRNTLLAKTTDRRVK